MASNNSPVAAPRLSQMLGSLKANISEVIRGKDSTIDQILVCLSAGGHILLEDLPGLGKTTLAYCLARSIDCKFSRIQFTSDMLPSDVVGISIYKELEHEFVFRKGPIFSSIVLADEINRATPKTQSALLEVMDRGKVTVDGETHAVSQPFLVFATQNPTDYEGTFPLPQSQMDRFMMRLRMGYPAIENEREILSRDASYTAYDRLTIQPVAKAEDILEIVRSIQDIFVEASVIDYMLQLVTATRSEAEFQAGISTRGALALKSASQAKALLQGRNFVIPADVASVYAAVFTHRLSLNRHVADPLEERRIVEHVLGRILDNVAQPS